MAKRRPTKAEREAKRYQEERQARERFMPRLAALSDYGEAMEMVMRGPPPTDIARPLYSNLGWFLQSFAPPGGASAEEKRLYIQFIERIDAKGQLKPGVRDEVVAALQKSIDARPWA